MAWSTQIDFGEGVLWAITQSRSWHHRKVESLRLLDGPQSNRRISIDLTVPADQRLHVVADVPGAETEVFVPLAIVQKHHLQAFDARMEGSRPVSVATSELDGVAMSGAIAHAWSLDVARELNSSEKAFIDGVVLDQPGSPTFRLVTDVLADGSAGGVTVDVAHLTSLTIRLLEIASTNFVLAALLPASAAGQHAVVKYQSHWELVNVEDAERLGVWARYKSALGWDAAPLEIELNDVGLVPGSLHLEVQAPSALFSERLELLQDSVVIAEDRRPTVISHVVTQPTNELNLPDTAMVHLRASPFGLMPWATMLAVFTFLFLWTVFLVNPLLTSLLSAEARVSAPVFLSAIALLLGIVTRTSENPLSGKVLGPLRLTVASLAFVYFALAMAIVLGIPDHLAMVVWLACSFYVSFVTLMLVVGYAQCRNSAVRMN